MTPRPNVRGSIFAAVDAERQRQDAQFGVQDHPDVDRVLTTREGGCSLVRMAEEYEIPTAPRAQYCTEAAKKARGLTWFHLHVEEIAEALDAATVAALEDDPDAKNAALDALDRELVQVAALAVAHLEALRTRRGKAPASEAPTAKVIPLRPASGVRPALHIPTASPIVLRVQELLAPEALTAPPEEPAP